MSGPSLKRRLVLAATGALALMLLLTTVGFNLVLAHRLSADAQDVVHSRAQAGLAVVSYEHGRLVVRETPHDAALDERVWVFEGSHPIERVQASPAVRAAVARLATARHAESREVGSQRLLAEPIVERGRHLGAVVATVSLLPYRHSQRIALVASVVLSLLILLAMAAVARILVGRALRPVARMTAQAADWSEHDLDRRFALGPPRDELTGLAATLDALLGRLSASLRHEKRFSAEVAHELRTPLSQLRTEADLALARERSPAELREAFAAVRGYTDRMAAVVDTLMAAAEREADPGSGTVDAYEAARAAVEAAAESAAEHGVAITVVPPREPIEVGADAELTAALLVPLLLNAVRHGRSRLQVSIEREGEAAVFRVIDDGPGVPAAELEAVFEPGFRGSAANGSPGAGLGLPLARRLARSAGGDVMAEPAPAGGRFAVRLPAG